MMMVYKRRCCSSQFALTLAVAMMPGAALAQLAAPPATTVADDSAIATPVISVSPIVVAAPGRGENLHLRVSAPTTGRQLPIIIFSHGNGSSSDGYAPLVNFWASSGFVVIQPTHLDSRTLGLGTNDPRTPLIWRFRIEDMKRILNHLDFIEASVPRLKGRFDRSRIAAAGHSYGGVTTAMLLGARVLDRDGRNGEDMSDARIKAGVLLSTPGRGGADLSSFAAQHFPFMNPGFAEMKPPTLVIAGDKDISRLTVRGPDWFTDPYVLSSTNKCLVTLFGAQHMLGGISGAGVTETTDESPDRVAAVQRLTLAYLRSALYPENPAWATARAALINRPNPPGQIECK